MTLYRLGVCLKCRGDLAYDDGDWICLQCGVYYYTGLHPEPQPPAPGAPLLRIAAMPHPSPQLPRQTTKIPARRPRPNL